MTFPAFADKRIKECYLSSTPNIIKKCEHTAFLLPKLDAYRTFFVSMSQKIADTMMVIQGFMAA
jgi:hypothetical protein